MEIVDHLLVVAHLLGMAALVGSALFVARGRVTPALLWGARAQLITGLLLVGVLEMQDETLNHMKIGIKLLVALAALVCAEIAGAKAKKGQERATLVTAAGVLGLVNVLVAVLW